MLNAKSYLQQLSTDKILQLVEEMKKPSHSIRSPLRNVINTIWKDDVGIFVLRIQELLWPMLEILAERTEDKPTSKKTLKDEKIRQLAPKMYKAIDKLINCDHQEHLITRLNNPETEAVESMKKILVSIEKY